jgi:hypothetical protein
MKRLNDLLSGGDLRSIGDVNKLISRINTQKEFDELFFFLNSDDRLVVMRAADAIEKITIKNPEYLNKYKKSILKFLDIAEDKEFKWHLALLISRIKLNSDDRKKVFMKLSEWASDKEESRIARVNSVQTLFTLTGDDPELKKAFDLILKELKKENIPSINARLKKLNLF